MAWILYWKSWGWVMIAEVVIVFQSVLIIALCVVLYKCTKKGIGKKNPESLQQAAQFLEDLQKYGGGLIHVQRVNPKDVWLRSP